MHYIYIYAHHTIVIIILGLLGIIGYQIFDKKGIKTDDVKSFIKKCLKKIKTRTEEFKQKRATSKMRQKGPKQIELYKQVSVDSTENKEQYESLVSRKRNSTGIITIILTSIIAFIAFVFWTVLGLFVFGVLEGGFGLSRFLFLAGITNTTLLQGIITIPLLLGIIIGAMRAIQYLKAKKLANKLVNGLLWIILITCLLFSVCFIFSARYDTDENYEACILCALITIVISLLCSFVLAMRKFGFSKALCCVILIMFIYCFSYKKIMFDYNGKYAKERLIYDIECGFCILITYYPKYREEEAKGFAVTNISFYDLLTEKGFINNRDGDDCADSDSLLHSYQSGGTNLLENFFSYLLFGTSTTAKSIPIGYHGKYYILSSN
ncbi:MAG: hypothetical protein IKZ86_13135 [Spirochaetaceae bacterium]|nr:hypothetical protein [Spirochaetaceae bacterium]